tara:strand:- start:8557 stop:10773 length:2217 start_codon:yes stop_codon:yes gene_type:complete
MPFQVSPGVNVSEIDLTTVVPSVSTSIGVVAGRFNWGPMSKRVLVENEDILAAGFGKPTNDNYQEWFTAAQFLNYSNQLYIGRLNNGANNAASNTTAAAIQVLNDDDYEVKEAAVGLGANQWLAKYPGALGNSLKVATCTGSAMWESTPLTKFYFVAGSTAANTSDNIGLSLSAGDYLYHANSSVRIDLQVASTSNTTITTAAADFAIDSAGPHTITQAAGDFVAEGYLTGANIIISLADDPTNNGTYVIEDVTALVITVEATSGPNDNGFAATTASDTTVTFSVAWSDIVLESAPTSVDLGGVSVDTTYALIKRRWEYYPVFDGAPTTSAFAAARGGSNDEIHVAVIDEDGDITGVKDSVLEVYPFVSRASDARRDDGGSAYYKRAINTQSKWIWWGQHDTAQGFTGVTASDEATTAFTVTGLLGDEARFSLTNGADGAAATQGQITDAYDLFANGEEIDISIIMAAAATAPIAQHLIQQIAEIRKDCVVTVSPEYADVVNNATFSGSEMEDVIAFRNAINVSSSYAIMDSGWKYIYDKYNDVYRYVPLNGDIAGTMARTDNVRDPWWSPAGYTRGNIRNIVKLAYNPAKTQRDGLYKAGVNSVVTFPGQGTILYGDKTMMSRPSAFDRINVRRLFIVLEKAIASAAKYTLFEFNDAFTRAQFRNLVEPYLRDVQGRRGIYDFKVVCDETNNTPEVIDRNEFIGDIYIKPARSINFIQLNFVAVRTGVDFEEIVGQF